MQGKVRKRKKTFFPLTFKHFCHETCALAMAVAGIEKLKYSDDDAVKNEKKKQNFHTSLNNFVLHIKVVANIKMKNGDVMRCDRMIIT